MEEEVLEKEETCACTEEKKECSCKKEKKKDKAKKEFLELEKKIEEQDTKIKELLTKLQYSQAELINYRKRKEEETENRLKFANQGLIEELIPILDNFERAIKLDDNDLTDELSKFLAGFKMMYASFNEVLKQFGVEEISCEGSFNPNEMQALMMDQDENFQDDEVIEVLLKGYKLKGRVIRPASVKVNKLENKGEDENE